MLKGKSEKSTHVRWRKSILAPFGSSFTRKFAYRSSGTVPKSNTTTRRRNMKKTKRIKMRILRKMKKKKKIVSFLSKNKRSP